MPSTSRTPAMAATSCRCASASPWPCSACCSRSPRRKVGCERARAGAGARRAAARARQVPGAGHQASRGGAEPAAAARDAPMPASEREGHGADRQARSIAISRESQAAQKWVDSLRSGDRGARRGAGGVRARAARRRVRHRHRLDRAAAAAARAWLAGDRLGVASIGLLGMTYLHTRSHTPRRRGEDRGDREGLSRAARSGTRPATPIRRSSTRCSRLRRRTRSVSATISTSITR